MYHLAFETSCDDTSIALMQDERLVAMVTKSQIEEHLETQWVVPEVAARLHANVIFDVLDEVLTQGKASLPEIGFLSCTSEPGLIPSLLVGKTVAKTLADSLGIEVQWINHIEGHIFANLLERSSDEISWPGVVLTVSGGHNELYLWKSLYEWELVGQTRDDAAGEAFDKVAKAMGLGFPGGPIVAKLASEYDGQYRQLFPVPLLWEESLDFSFSGLKSAVKREIDLRKGKGNVSVEGMWQIGGVLPVEDMRQIAFEFEHSIVQVLVTKLFRAAKRFGVGTVVLAGGVSANDFLRSSIQAKAQMEGYRFVAPVKKIYSMDNAAMIGIRGWYEWKRTHPLEFPSRKNADYQ